MFKANKNVGLYLELEQLINYVEDFNDETLVDSLLKKFKGDGLTVVELREVTSLINKYLPPHIECDNNGCYFVTEITDIDSGEQVLLRTSIPQVPNILELPIETITHDLIEV